MSSLPTSHQESSTREVLAGLVERVTFHNAENGFCVLRIKARGHRDLITVVGHAAVIAAGEWVTASGEWVNDRTHGQQFKSRFMRTSAPTSIEGIEKYLGSGMIRGIGPVYAKKLVRAFGEKVFDVIEAEPDRLREVTGIGPMRAKRITGAWAEQKIVREIMVFLHSHGVGTARAVRIFKTYGADAVQVMTENPYRLARDIRGIGFKTADAIAMRLGIEKTAMIRVRAGISYALTEAMDEGHCGLPTEELTPLAVELLEVPAELIQTALDLELAERTVIADTVGRRPAFSSPASTGPSRSRARRRLRLIQAKVRSTIQRLGSTTKRWASLRLTICKLQRRSWRRLRPSWPLIAGIGEDAFDEREGSPRRARAGQPAPSRSWTLAGWTTTLSRRPSVSTRMCRLRPVTFLPASKPCGSSAEPPFERPWRSGCR